MSSLLPLHGTKFDSSRFGADVALVHSTAASRGGVGGGGGGGAAPASSDLGALDFLLFFSDVCTTTHIAIS